MVTIHAISGRTITLGREGENLARQVVFDVSEWRSSYGDGTVSLIAQRHRDTEPYPCNITVDGDTITWPITAADTAHPDYGRCELRYTVGDVLVKSETWRTYTADALGTPSPTPPEPQKAWVDKVLEAGQAAVDASVNPPRIGNNGNWWVWDFGTGAYVDTGVAASGGGSGAVSSVNGKTGAVELTAGDVGAVTSPATAAVGQTVVVKAVDETGKPTAWEAADMVGGSNYELIETIIVGYAITLAEPDDWAENFTAYFTNEGTIRDPDYVALSGDAAPVWEAGKYYSYSADGVTSISRTKEPDGNSYSFKNLAVLCVPVDSSKFRFDLWYGNDSKYNYAYIPIAGLLQGKNCVVMVEDAGFNGHPMMHIAWGYWHTSTSPNKGYEVKQSYQETGYLTWGAKYEKQAFYRLSIQGIDTTKVIPSGVTIRILGERA